MLGDRQELDMGEAHVDDVGDELLGELVVAQEAAVVLAAATSRDAPRRSTSACAAASPFAAPRQIRVVGPGEASVRGDDRGGRGPQLGCRSRTGRP